ncbi:MAG: CocE/NonD family hydrolase [Steroidobacteraceae bacterium]|jgi:putative CocE/NonD family hydrolase|nr:CocE/NonD family hydrolase [Steroidobacteraceae bacterium]
MQARPTIGGGDTGRALRCRLGWVAANALLAALLWVDLGTPPAAAAADVPKPTDRRSDRSYYLAMRDGVRLAVSVYFPAGWTEGRRAPAVLMQTRYGRAGLGRWPRSARWLDDGFVLVAVDTRGSTASEGVRLTELSPDQIADIDELVRHVAAQPWSNGQVVAAGQSYAANTADLATSRPAPALLGAVVHQVDFDIYLHVVAPGGVVNRWFLEEWGTLTRNMDLGRAIKGLGEATADAPAADCRLRAEDCRRLYPVLQPVDDDPGFAQLRAALSGKHRWLPSDVLNIAFRDDRGHNGFSFLDMSPGAAMAGVRRERKPMQYWGSWIDGGTAEAALARFRSAPDVPMELWITANDHSNVLNADPFLPDRREPAPSFAEQNAIQSDFVRRLVEGRPISRRVNYYVLGTGEFRTTDVWPPADVKSRTFHFAAGRALAEKSGASGTDAYDVDRTVGTGEKTRWSTQIGIPPQYPDRREIGRRLLTYDTAPMASAVEIVGAPVVDLKVATLSDDPAFFVYVEDVAPDGRVTYVTEGMLRALHRKPADPASLPYDHGPVPLSFRRLDAQLVDPGEPMRVRFALFPTAARIAEGHRIRISIAGADASVFTLYPAEGPERFTVHFGGPEGSRVELPLRDAKRLVLRGPVAVGFGTPAAGPWVAAWNSASSATSSPSSSTAATTVPRSTQPSPRRR